MEIKDIYLYTRITCIYGEMRREGKLEEIELVGTYKANRVLIRR